MAGKRPKPANGKSLPPGRILMSQPHPAYFHQGSVRRTNPVLLSSIPPPELSTILVQAVVTLGAKTTAGNLIIAVAPAWAEIIRLIRDDPNILFKIDARKLEELIAAAYERAGFDEVVLTPRSGDLGRDVIASRRNWGRVRFIDQVKAYKPGHLVTAEEVRALGFVLMSDQNATKGFVTTTSDFAPRIKEDPLIRPHMPYRIELVNGSELAKRLGELPTDA